VKLWNANSPNISYRQNLPTFAKDALTNRIGPPKIVWNNLTYYVIKIQ